jgi:hypothetical protein
MLKPVKGLGYLSLAYYIIYSDRSSYLQSNSFKLDVASWLISLNSWETFFLAIVSFYLLLSWLLFGFFLCAAIFAVILTIIAEWYYSGQITYDMASSMSDMAYFLLMILGIYSFVAGIFCVRTWNIRVEYYRPSRPLFLQLINVIATD